MPTNFKISPFKLGFGTVGAFFLLSGLIELTGDTFATLFYNINELKKFSGLADSILLLFLSMVIGLVAIVFGVVKLFIDKDSRFSILIGVIVAFIITFVLVWTSNIDPIVGNLNFDFKEDYLDILRNLTMGVLVMVILYQTSRLNTDESKAQR